MPHELAHHYWHRQPCVHDAVAARYRNVWPPGGSSWTSGRGTIRSSLSTEVVDMRRWKTFGARTVHLVDLESEPLPYTYKQVDFLYSRHTLEDLHNPLHLCREMNRVAKAGYIEVPSPASEFCRGVDGGKPHYRGYIHHRYFIWREDETLVFLPKYPYVEYVGMSDELEQRLAGLPGFDARGVEHLLPVERVLSLQAAAPRYRLRLRPGYPDLILKAVNASIADAQRFAAEFGLGTATFVPSA